MRTASLDLDLFGHHLRVVSEDQDAATQLQSMLTGHLAPTPAPTGFVLKRPSEDNNLYLLLDRSGFVLSRSRSRDDCLASLVGHLGAFVPPASDTVRLRMRAFLAADNETAVLAVPPLFLDPPTVERRVERAGFRMLDRLAVDISRDGALCLQTPTWPSWSGQEPPGHAVTATGNFAITALLVPQFGTEPSSRASVVAQLASLGSPAQSRAARLKIADQLAELPLRAVSLSKPADRYRALSG